MLPAFRVAGPHLPEPPEPGSGLQPDFRFSTFGRPGEGRSEISALAVEAL
jgi:hypothetical protein